MALWIKPLGPFEIFLALSICYKVLVSRPRLKSVLVKTRINPCLLVIIFNLFSVGKIIVALLFCETRPTLSQQRKLKVLRILERSV
jgi:hypothetical protein